MNLLKELDYSVVQQCMHCGLCLPVCPTYDATKNERNSPRGRISLMRSIADDRLSVTRTFGDEMYFCLGCLACQTACPASVDYAELFETARAEIEREQVLETPMRRFWRGITLRGIFAHPVLLRALGKFLWAYQQSGLQRWIRKIGLLCLLPSRWREWEAMLPAASPSNSDQLMHEVEPAVEPKRFRIGLLSGCVQDVFFAEVNRDTMEVLRVNHCEVVTPRSQPCCGSLHAHNGELEAARDLARRTIDQFDLDSLDAIITNAAGCGSHLKHYDRLLADDPNYQKKAGQWSAKVRDIHEWLDEIGIRNPQTSLPAQVVTYHEACHLCHGQGISRQPRAILKSIPGLELVELTEATWCCGSAGVYNLTQPEMAQQLLDRKMKHIAETRAQTVATANPGCLIQLQQGARAQGIPLKIVHPISLLAEAYRQEHHSKS